MSHNTETRAARRPRLGAVMHLYLIHIFRDGVELSCEQSWERDEIGAEITAQIDCQLLGGDHYSVELA